MALGTAHMIPVNESYPGEASWELHYEAENGGGLGAWALGFAFLFLFLFKKKN